MSRALDEATAAALKSGDAEAAFRAVSGVLTEPAPASGAYLEIEFIGADHPLLGNGSCLVRDGPAVGIPKLVLVQAFFVARTMLQRYRAAPSATGEAAALSATAVILLFDPEHLTAANTRKRILQARVQGGDAPLVASELHLVDSLLTSHLHRHTKSPTLWSHRRWLTSLLPPGPAASHAAVLRDDMASVVMMAAVRHPRNYYAWDHARWLVTRGGAAGLPEAEALVGSVRDWCCRHHDDTAGWSFLLFLLARQGSASDLFRRTVAHVLDRAASLRWTGESVWVFLRTAAAYPQPQQETAEAAEEQRTRLIQTATDLQARLPRESPDWMVLQRAVSWRPALS